MAKKTLQVNINEPCHEDWNKMTATQCGAFCKSCQKEVIDFTNKSEGEIVDILSIASGKVCGRFTADKLNKPLTKFEPDPEWYSWKKWAVAAGVLFGVSSLNADTNNKQAVVDTTYLPADTTTKEKIELVEPPMVGMIAIMPEADTTVVVDTAIQTIEILEADTTATVDTTVAEPVLMGEPMIMGDLSTEFIMGKIAMPQKNCNPKKDK